MVLFGIPIPNAIIMHTKIKGLIFAFSSLFKIYISLFLFFIVQHVVENKGEE